MALGIHLPVTPLLGIDITPGIHPQFKLFGLTFDADIIWATVIAALRSSATSLPLTAGIVSLYTASRSG